MKIFLFSFSALFIYICSINSIALAGEFLTGEGINSLVNGKTHITKNRKGKKFERYYGEDGIMNIDGKPVAKWKVSADKLCIQFYGKKQKCGTIKKGKKNYKIIGSDGKKKHSFKIY